MDLFESKRIQRKPKDFEHYYIIIEKQQMGIVPYTSNGT